MPTSLPGSSDDAPLQPRGPRRPVPREHPLSHIGSIAAWTPQAIAWVNARFAGRDTPQNCGTIKPGNPVEPVPIP